MAGPGQASSLLTEPGSLMPPGRLAYAGWRPPGRGLNPSVPAATGCHSVAVSGVFPQGWGVGPQSVGV